MLGRVSLKSVLGRFSAVFSRAATLQKCGVKFFSVFLCQKCHEIWHEILVKFSVLHFPGFGCPRENFTKFQAKNGVKTENFTQISLCWGVALSFYLSGPMRDTPPHVAQYPFEMVSQRGGIARVLPCFHRASRKYR